MLAEWDAKVKANKEELEAKKAKRLARNKKARSSRALYYKTDNNESRLWCDNG